MYTYLAWWQKEEGPVNLGFTTEKSKWKWILEDVLNNYINYQVFNYHWRSDYCYDVWDEVMQKFKKLALKNDEELLKICGFDSKRDLLGRGRDVNIQIMQGK